MPLCSERRSFAEKCFIGFCSHFELYVCTINDAIVFVNAWVYNYSVASYVGCSFEAYAMILRCHHSLVPAKEECLKTSANLLKDHVETKCAQTLYIAFDGLASSGKFFVNISKINLPALFFRPAFERIPADCSLRICVVKGKHLCRCQCKLYVSDKAVFTIGDGPVEETASRFYNALLFCFSRLVFWQRCWWEKSGLCCTKRNNAKWCQVGNQSCEKWNLRIRLQRHSRLLLSESWALEKDMIGD